ncbi:unnamed protein product, partial [Rotaria sp. Silwood1]
GGFNNTFYGHENDVLNVSSATGKTLTVAACFYGIDSATPGCGGSTVSANCLSMNVSSTCRTLCNSSYCYYTIDNANFGTPALGRSGSWYGSAFIDLVMAEGWAVR